ncbi:hypothetical protein GALMADRAFT_1030637 [Galerina marginata CBS 339.88]|uniref:Uncharacterized protein n=1 Tax=Galerina marginata (strain CBS 339.88) TaxID=685588 RepID=A0A067SCY5_GALM3|nr:hypothetical protein GALMADRAFT_1030637 [Galerina marginata CBS 339.88]
MKFAIVNVAVICFATLAYAAPLMDASDVLETLGFHSSGPNVKQAAKNFVNEAHHGGQLSTAASGGSSAKTVKSNNAFHLDRQQPTNSHGSHKVAVQLNHGSPSTVGQVAIHKGHQPSSSKVAQKLRHSVQTGKETHINHPGSKKSSNIQKNHAASAAKSQRHSQARKSGESRAKSGVFKKGRK